MVPFVILHALDTPPEGQEWIPAAIDAGCIYIRIKSEGLPTLLCGRGVPAAVMSRAFEMRAKADGLWSALFGMPPSEAPILLLFADGHDPAASAVKVISFEMSDDGQTIRNKAAVDFSTDALLAAS